MTRFLRAVLCSVVLGCMFTTLGAASDCTILSLTTGRVVMEFVGQFNNTPTTSQQFGYVSNLRGLNTIFSGMPENEATALFTFVTDATTDRVIVNGPFRIINRTGITRIYLNTPPSDFSNPTSFSQGQLIQESTYTQQVVLNIATSTFTTVHINRITKTAAFVLGGANYRLGRVGRSFRTIYSGSVNTPGSSPSGWFAGYALGVW